MKNHSSACKICNANSHPFGTATVLKQHTVAYFRCTQCGFIQTEEPYWLGEAYSSAITNSDVGLVQRNVELTPVVTLIIKSLFNTKGSFVDYGGGYGLFVRLMRDRGLNFFWHDPHCENLFAKYFEAIPASKHQYNLLTAFEVLEHLVDPWKELNEMQYLAENLLFTTTILPTPVPSLDKWWYYGLEHGQHVSFYTIQSLRIVGQKLGLNLYTNGANLHLFASKSINPLAFRLATSGHIVKLFRLWDIVYHNSSLIRADYQSITGRTLE